MDMIFWFSGTGNSLYAAKKLSAALGGAPLMKMTEESAPVGGEGKRVGFVFPSYYGNLPRLVRAFVRNLTILPGTYVFAVVTGGGATTGSIRELRALLAEKGGTLHYGRRLFMKGNYVASYNPADPAQMDATLDKADRRVLRFARDISAGARYVRPLPLTSDNLYKNIESLDAAFRVSDACTGCGLCEKLCPVKNIRLQGEGRAEWLHHCEHCMACISWCPVRAIDYGEKTKPWRRYHNPRIQVQELL